MWIPYLPAIRPHPNFDISKRGKKKEKKKGKKEEKKNGQNKIIIIFSKTLLFFYKLIPNSSIFL